VQKHSVLPEVKRFSIQRQLWAQLSHDDRAGLVLHEIIYREAIEKGHKDSRMARYLNALVGSQQLDHFTQAQYDDRINKSGFGNPTGPMAPMWAADPIRLEPAREGVLYESSLEPYLHGTKPITVHKVQGPSWLYIGYDGALRGTPPIGETGTVRLKVRAVGIQGKTADANAVIQLVD
jgi:hypothetical protein